MLRNRLALLGAPRAERLAQFMVDKHAAVDGQGRRIAVALPCVIANRQRQVQVLVAVVEAFIPSAHGLERLALDQYTEAGQNPHVVDFRHPPVERHLLVAHYAVGHRPAGEKPAVLARRHHLGEPVAVQRKSVVVDKQNPRGRAFTREHVVAAREIQVLVAALNGDFQTAIQSHARRHVHAAHQPPVVAAVLAAVVQQMQRVLHARRVLNQMRQKARSDFAGVVREYADVNLSGQRRPPCAEARCIRSCRGLAVAGA